MPNGKVYKGDTFANLLREYALDREKEDPTFTAPKLPIAPAPRSKGNTYGR